MFALERATTTRRAGLWTVVGLVLVPLVVAAGFLWAGWNSDDRLGRVSAAVVNLDDPVKLDGQLVPLGRQLAGGLVAEHDDPNFSWVLTDADDASAGLAAGRYAAVVTIPKSFSANATSFAKTDADQIHHANVDVQTSQVGGLADPVVGQAITAQATKVLNASLTESYLKKVYLGFNEQGRQFGKLADAAGQLSDGTGALAGGLTKTADGTQQLADGLDQLDDGTAKLANGIGTYATGVHAYAKGVGQLADGAGQSASGAKKLAKGADQLDDGADQLADGADGIAGGLQVLQRGSKATHGLGTASNAANVEALAGGARQFRSTFAGLSSASDAELAKSPLACPQELADAQACAAYYAGVKAGTGAAAAGSADLVDGTAGLAQAAAGLDSVVSGLRFGPNGKTGVRAYAKGSHAYATGVHTFAKGAHTLARGLDSLADGTDQLATGARKLASGADGIHDGAVSLSGGTAQSASGAAKLAGGLDKLSTGGSKLASGSDTFATGLAKGQQQVPSYDKATRTKLSSVVTAPVSSGTVKKIFPDVASTTFLTAVALWLGGLVSFLVLRAVSGRVLSSMRPSWWLVLHGLLPAALVGVLQAGVLSGALGALLHLDAGEIGGVAAFATLTAVTFAAVNHALVAWFGGVGRFVSVVVVVLAAAGGITSALPVAFDTLTPYLPTTPALAGLRALVTDGPGAGNAAGLLFGWLLLAVVASVLAVARRRMVAPLPAVLAPA